MEDEEYDSQHVPDEMTHTDFIHKIQGIAEDLEQDELETFCRDPQTFITTHVHQLNPNPAWVNVKAIQAVLYLSLSEESESDKDLQNALNMFLSSLNLPSEPGFAYAIFWASIKARATFEATMDFFYLNSALDCMGKFFDIQEPKSTAYLMAAAAMIPMFLFYFLNNKVEEPLEEGIKLFDRIAESGRWLSTYGAERTLLITGHVIANRYEGFGPDQDFDPTAERIIQILNLFPTRDVSNSTPLELVSILWLLKLSENTDLEEWDDVLDTLHKILHISFHGGPGSPAENSVFETLMESLKECYTEVRSLATCLVSLSDTIKHRGLIPRIVPDNRYTVGDSGQRLWIHEFREINKYFMHVLTCMRNGSQIILPNPAVHKFFIKPIYIHGFKPSSGAASDHSCALDAEFIPLSDDQTTQVVTSHSDFVRILDGLCKSIPQSDWSLPINNDGPVVMDIVAELEKISPTWAKSEGVLGYIFAYRGITEAVKSSDISESCSLLGHIDLAEEPGFQYMLYCVAGKLALEESNEDDQRGAAVLFRELIRVQKAGTPLLFMGVVQLVLRQLSLAILSGKCAPLAAAIELFRDATEQMGYKSWRKEGRKCLFLGFILHLRYMRTEVSNEVLQEASITMQSILDFLPDNHPRMISSLESFVVSALITLAQSSHTVDWIDSMKLFREVIASCTQPQNVSFRLPEDIWDRFVLETTTTNLLENGIYPFHYTINNRAQCIINSADTISNLIEDISAPPYSLSLAFRIYLNSQRPDVALSSPPDIEEKLVESWRSIKDVLNNALEQFNGTGSMTGLSCQDLVFRYSASRRLRTDRVGRTAHTCLSRYILLDNGDGRLRPIKRPNLDDRWPDQVALSPPYVGYEGYEVDFPLNDFLDISYKKVAAVIAEGLSLPISGRASEALTRDFISATKGNSKDLAVIGEKTLNQDTFRDVHWSPNDVLLENRLQKLKNDSDLGPTNSLQTLLYRGPERAVEVVEKSRSLFWSRLMKLRADFSHLPPELGDKLEIVADALEKCKGQRERGASKEEAKLQLELEAEFRSLLGKARMIPGFEKFLLPKSFDDLVAAASQGPIIYLLVDKDTTAALIVSSRGADAIPLQLTSTMMATMFRVLTKAQKDGRSAAESDENEDRSSKAVGSGGRTPYENHLKILWRFIVQPVLEKLNLLTSPPPPLDKRPRVWWCPSGPFSFYPIHAAVTGLGTENVRYASDYILSSYIPSIEALINVRQEMHGLPTASDLRALVVAQPVTPGYTSLPKTAKELELIQSLVPPSQLLRIGNSVEVENSEASLLATNANRNVEDVVKTLENASVLHLACHGTQSQKDPLNSGFELTNGRLTLSTLTSCHTPNAFLAYLSACESAANDLELPDESLNLAAAMLYTGFKSVVGTMRTMNDSDGPEVARTIYEELFTKNDSKLSPRAIPEALDRAARKLREQGVPAIRWVTYIHVGM